MVTIEPSSGPSDMPLAARASAASAAARGGALIDREASARPFPLGVGDARQRLFEPVAGGRRFHGECPELTMEQDSIADHIPVLPSSARVDRTEENKND